MTESQGGDRGFVLDAFQLDAMDAISAGRSVLVAAPTGAGKTVVAEHAIEVGLADNQRVFYTSPIKALANQKLRSFGRRYGADAVGLLTGDSSVNSQAPILVMTTEVLRNMLYESPGELHDLGWVVLDEVHFLQDRFRGPVWEEVILHLDRSVRIVGLSATVSNLDELTDWLRVVRGPTDLVVTHERPVPLRQQLGVSPRRHAQMQLIPVLIDGKPNPDGFEFDLPERERHRRRRDSRGHATPRRADVATHLEEVGLSPTIYFLFSRAGCDDAVRQCTQAGLRFTNRQEQRTIRAMLDRHLSRIPAQDRASLQLDAWEASVARGVASHHAGLIPAAKEAVEEAFAAGLITVVFATETLALGINMPARSVVLESLVKFNGETHELVTALEYTQLTGRAGRRGIDTEGDAIVLWNPRLEFDTLCQVASSRSYPVRSAFRPNYNMTANLIRRFNRADAHAVVGRSFAQFQTDRAAVGVHDEARRLRERADQAEKDAHCERGDVRGFRAALVDGDADQGDPVEDISAALSGFKPGDIISAPSLGVVVVLSSTERKRGPRLRVVHPSGGVSQLETEELQHVPSLLAEVTLPQPFRPKSPEYHRAAAELLADHTGSDDAQGGVKDCPDLRDHLAQLDRADRLRSRATRAEGRLDHRQGLLASKLDAMAGLLAVLGYADGWSLTDDGEGLAAIHHEGDLLIAEALRHNAFDGLAPAELAAVASGISFEPRRNDEAPDWSMPSKRCNAAMRQLRDLTKRVQATERDLLGDVQSPAIEPGFARAAHAWALGASLSKVIENPDEAGAFVRNARQLIDVLTVLSEIAPDDALHHAAADAVELINRGVVRSMGPTRSVAAADDQASTTGPSEERGTEREDAGAPDGDPSG